MQRPGGVTLPASLCCCRRCLPLSAGDESDHADTYAEQGKGGLAFLARSFLGHFRRFEIHFFDTARALVLCAVHPFRWFFQRLEVSFADGRPIGAIQQRFAIFSTVL